MRAACAAVVAAAPRASTASLLHRNPLARSAQVVYDVTSQETFDNVKQWLSEIDRWVPGAAMGHQLHPRSSLGLASHAGAPPPPPCVCGMPP